MITLADIAYVRSGVADLDAATRFATQIVGLELAAPTEDGVAHLRADHRHHCLALVEGPSGVIASGFADIFYNNCFQNGLLPIALPREQVRALMGEAKGGNHVFSVDLEAQTVTAPSGQVFTFEIDPGRKEKLLKGLDAIGETLQAADEITSYEARRALDRPWLEAAA